MKKLILMLLTVLLLAGCSSPQTPVQTDSTEGEQQAIHKQTESLSMERTESIETEKQPSKVSNQTESVGSAEPTEPTGSKPTESTAPPATQPPHEHQYTASTVAATCTAQGYTLYSCSCGDSYRDNTTPALGHDYTETVIAPTTDAQGYTRHTCTRCCDSYDDTYVDKLKVIYDINRAMEVGNAYAISVGFQIDYSLNAGNAGYDFPQLGIESASIERLGGQAWLESRMCAFVDGTKYNLAYWASGRGDDRPFEEMGARGRCYIEYHADSDTYDIYFFYG